MIAFIDGHRAGGMAVAILKTSALVGHLVPVEAVQASDGHHYATMEDVMESLAHRRATNQPVLDDLRDK